MCTQVKQWWPWHMSSLQPPPWQPPQSSPTRACYLWQRLCSLPLTYFVVLPEPSALLTVDQHFVLQEISSIPGQTKHATLMAFSCFSQLNGDRPQAAKKPQRWKGWGKLWTLQEVTCWWMFFSCPHTSYEHSSQTGITFCVILCFSFYLGMALKADTVCSFIF